MAEDEDDAAIVRLAEATVAAGRKPDQEWLDAVIDTVGLADRLDHRPGDNHAERPERLRAVIDALLPKVEGIARLGPDPLADDLSLPESDDEESADFPPAGSLSFFAPSPEPEPDPLRLSVR